jgi:hypothetical protein
MDSWYLKTGRICFFVIVVCCINPLNAYERSLFNLENNFNAGSVQATDAQVLLVNDSSGKAIRVAFGRQSQNPSISLFPIAADLTTYVYVTMNVRNVGAHDVAVQANLNDVDWINGIALVKPGETQMLSIILKRLTPPSYITGYLTAMHGIPGGYVWLFSAANYSNVNKINIYVTMPKDTGIIEIDSIEAREQYALPDTQTLTTTYFPFIDTLDQYKYLEWPGKAHSVKDMQDQYQSEQTDLAQNPGPADLDEYGGWTKGPKLRATGHFRVEKYQNKW